MRKKFKIRYVIIPLLCVALVGGGISALVAKKQADSVAEVVSAREVDYTYMVGGVGDYYTGKLKQGSILNVKIDSELEIEEVKVKKGDTVKKGDVLLTYNTASLEMNVEEIESNIKRIENEEQIANNQLDVLKRLLPSEDAPNNDDVTDMPESYDVPSMDIVGSDTQFEYEKKITVKSKPISGEGTQDNPFVFNAGENTVVTQEYLNYLSGNAFEVSSKANDTDGADNDKTAKQESGTGTAKYALIHIYNENGVMLYSRFIDGSLITANDMTDWVCSSGVTLNEDGSLYFEQSGDSFAKVITYTQGGSLSDFEVDTDMYGDMISGDYNYEDMLAGDMQDSIDMYNSNATDEITLDDNYIYSREELKNMIAEKENELERLALSKKQADINLRAAKKRLETGAEIAEISGTVTFVAKDKKHLSDNGAYITITNNNGMSIVCTVGEFSLDEIQVGKIMSISNYDDGNTYSGTVTSISDVPTQDGSMSYYSDTSQSYYEFIVTVDEEFELTEDRYVDVVPLVDGESEVVCVDSAFVREENGRFYIMVANENDVLEKRYVEIGKKHFGIAVEVKKGLSWDDRIAFPYGNVYEGMPVVDVSYDEIMYGSFF